MKKSVHKVKKRILKSINVFLILVLLFSSVHLRIFLSVKAESIQEIQQEIVEETFEDSHPIEDHSDGTSSNDVSKDLDFSIYSRLEFLDSDFENDKIPPTITLSYQIQQQTQLNRIHKMYPKI